MARHAAKEDASEEGQWIPLVRPDPDPKDTRGKRQPNRRPGPKHEGSKPPTKPRAPKATTAPTLELPTVERHRPGPRRRGRGNDVAGVLGEQARDHAHRAAYRATSSRPSVTGRAASGAAAGAASGAALGSVVPGVGTAVGAGAGAVVGGSTGAVAGHHAKKAWKAARRWDGGWTQRVLVAEFAVCIVIVTLSPMTDRHKAEPPGAFMKRAVGVLGLFFVLGLISAAGRGGSRFAAGLGGLVTVTLAVSERDVFAKLAGSLNAPPKKPRPIGPGEADPDNKLGQIAGGTIGRFS